MPRRSRLRTAAAAPAVLALLLPPAAEGTAVLRPAPESSTVPGLDAPVEIRVDRTRTDLPGQAW